MGFGLKDRVSPGGAREDDIHTIADCDLAVIELQYDRQHVARLGNPTETGSDGVAVETKSIWSSPASSNRLKVFEHVARTSSYA
jgi:hypothetical protein